jgi:predicted ATPase/DNA-binding winged helix-turn-helix (wHTH) protein
VLSSAAVTLCRFGEFTLDLSRASLRRGEMEVALRPKSLRLLSHLAANAGRVMSRDELYAVLWPRAVVTDDSLTRCISDVREALGDRDRHIVRTVSRLGYMFCAEVECGEGCAAAAFVAKPAAAAASEALSREAAVAWRTNLPAQLLPLIGRDDDLAHLQALLRQRRLICLVGAGGVGKSALAKALLHKHKAAFEHGVCWVDLASQFDPARVAGQVAASMGIAVTGGDARAALLRSLKPLQMLMTWDNAEHLAEEVAALAQALHDEAPGVQLIVTSQVPLRTGVERVYRLGSLALPPAAAGVAEACGFAAVELFLTRAQAADARFSLTDSNVGLAIDVCRRLDGLPLAIEMAAALAPWLGLPRLAETMHDRFRALVASHRSAPPRHKTLQAAMQWSHALLNESEQTVFRRLGVFAGSFSLELAQQTVADAELDPWDVLHGIGALVERSLLSASGGDEPRYRLLETPRAFALNGLRSAGDAPALRLRHAQAYRARLESAYRDHFSGREPIDRWRERLLPDLDDSRAALEWSIATDAQTAVSLAANLAFVLSSESPIDRRAVIEASKPLISDAIAKPLRARWAQEAAFSVADIHTPIAREWAQQAAAGFRELEQALDLYRTLGLLVYCASNTTDMQGSAEMAEMQAIEQPHWPPVVKAYGAHASACWHSARRNFEEALRWRRLCLQLYERAGYGWRSLVARSNLLDSLIAAGQADEAIACGSQLLGLLQGNRFVASMPAARLNFVAAMLLADDTAGARRLAIESWPQVIPIRWQAYWADYLALLACLERRPQAASRLLGYAQARYAALGVAREVNEALAFSRADSLARGMLGNERVDALGLQGAGLADDDIPALAFSAQDVS